jgi:hypothetical protein
MQKMNDEWRARFPDMGPLRIIVLADRSNPGSYVGFAEFGSYDEAMKNSEHPATAEYAAMMAELSDGPPTFRDFDVIRLESRS